MEAGTVRDARPDGRDPLETMVRIRHPFRCLPALLVPFCRGLPGLGRGGEGEGLPNPWFASIVEGKGLYSGCVGSGDATSLTACCDSSPGPYGETRFHCAGSAMARPITLPL